MRWFGFAALVLVATGCTVHVVEQPAVPVLLAEPTQPAHRVRVAARPAYVTPAARSPHARPPQTQPPVVAAPSAVPREPRPKQIATTIGAEAPRHRKPQKQKRLARFKLEPNDVPPIESEPAQPARTTRARSTSVAKAQKNAFDLRQ
jgi:hypothetical protein